MSLACVSITLNIRNNKTYPIRINVLGSPYNPLDTTNAKTEYRWDITAFTPSNDDTLTLEYKQYGAAVFSTYTSQIYNTNINGIIAALDGLGIGYFQSYTELGQLYLSTYNDVVEFGLLTISNNGAPATSTTTTTTTAAPTTTTTSSTTTAAPTTSTTTSTTTAAPTTSTTSTTTAAPTTSTTSTTTAAPTTSTTTSTTTAAPTTSTTSTTTAAPTTSTTSTTTAAPTSTTTTSTTAAPTSSTTTTTTAAPTTTSSTTTSTTAAVGGFTISNPSGSGQIDNVTTTGAALFYTINSGSFPVTTGGTIVAGLASLTASPIFVDISNFVSTSCLSLYINGILNESQTVTANGTYTFTNKTFSTSDTVLLEYVSGSC